MRRNNPTVISNKCRNQTNFPEATKLKIKDKLARRPYKARFQPRISIGQIYLQAPKGKDN